MIKTLIATPPATPTLDAPAPEVAVTVWVLILSPSANSVIPAIMLKPPV